MDNHKLIHGDCFEIMQGLDSESVDAIITDPPYGILKHKIETEIDIPSFFKECERILKPNKFLMFFGQQPTLTDWNYHAFQTFNYKNEMIWYKRIGGSPFLDMNRMFENITIVCKGKRKFNDIRLDYTDVALSLAEFIEKSSFDKRHATINQFINDRNLLCQLVDNLNGKPNYCQKNVSNNQKATMSQNNLLKEKIIFSNGKTVLTGYKPRNLVSFLSHNRKKLDMSGNGNGSHNVKHPTVKPLQLFDYLIRLGTLENDVILDPFVGSGTTILAGIESKRYVIGIEKELEYCEIAKQRIKEHIEQLKLI